MNTPAARLEGKLALVRPALQNAAQRLWTEKDAREIYTLYLEQMHMVVRSGVSLMETASLMANKLPCTFTKKMDLIDYLDKHIEEERGHDQWLLEDYEAAGGNPQHLLSKIPSSHVANMAGAQYYWIIHHHPVMVMGHIAALETNHPPQGFAMYLSQLTRLPIQAFRAIARHEKLDLAHKQEILQLIDSLNLAPREEVAVGVSGLHTLQSGIEVLTALRKNFDKKKPTHC